MYSPEVIKAASIFLGHEPTQEEMFELRQAAIAYFKEQGPEEYVRRFQGKPNFEHNFKALFGDQND